MDKTKKYLTISFIVVLIAVIIISAVGMLLLKKKPVILQGNTYLRKTPWAYRYVPCERGTACKSRRYACRHQQSGSNG